MQFKDIPLYTYLSGQEDLVALSQLVDTDGQPIANNELICIENTTDGAGKTSAYFLNSVPVQRADFAITSNLAKDIGDGLSDSLQWFHTHFIPNSTAPGATSGRIIDVTVDAYVTPDLDCDPAGNFICYSQAGVLAATGLSIMCIASLTTKVRS